MFTGPWALLVLVAALTAAGWAPRREAAPPHSAARAILDRRLARGEITHTEHAERRAVLETESPRRSGSWQPWAIVAGGAAILVSATLMWAPGWGWTGPGSMAHHKGWSGTTDTSARRRVGAPRRALRGLPAGSARRGRPAAPRHPARRHRPPDSCPLRRHHVRDLTPLVAARVGQLAARPPLPTLERSLLWPAPPATATAVPSRNGA